MVPFAQFETSTAEEILRWAATEFDHEIAISTSFQKEGMVLVDMVSRIAPGMRVFTIDTGRLPRETHQMIDTVERRYGLRVEVVRPDEGEVEAMVQSNGADLFYREVALRSLCCHIRKVRPLERKLATLRAWITGLRRDQAETRAGVAKVQEITGTVKISPLADWTARQVDDYTTRYAVPVHPLYAHGYRSIGCDPCTRAIAPGETERAGRWWWEEDHHKECGLHFTADGRVVRQLDVLVQEVLVKTA